MTKFFDDIVQFQKHLRRRKETGRQCWSCKERDSFLAAFNVRKDLISLGVSSPAGPSMITLCPPCAVAYMNSFNAQGAKVDGRENTAPPWTVASYLATTPKPAEPVFPQIHCDKHGTTDGCFVCRHLCENPSGNYFAIDPSTRLPMIQAWCEECMAVLEQERSWTNRAKEFADRRIICTPCFGMVVGHRRRLNLAA